MQLTVVSFKALESLAREGKIVKPTLTPAPAHRFSIRSLILLLQPSLHQQARTSYETETNGMWVNLLLPVTLSPPSVRSVCCCTVVLIDRFGLFHSFRRDQTLSFPQRTAGWVVRPPQPSGACHRYRLITSLLWPPNWSTNSFFIILILIRGLIILVNFEA